MSSYDPDDHFGLSSMGHSEPEFYNSTSARYAVMTLRLNTVIGVLTLNFGSRPKKLILYLVEILFFTNKNSD